MQYWLIELSGWIAAGLTLAAYSMRTMLPLRVAAIGANVFFIIYAALVPIFPTLILHSVLLPFNSYRLAELLRLEKKARETRASDEPLSWIGTLVSPVEFADGDVIFAKGDPPDHVYYLDSGQVYLEEIDITLKPGDLFGEIAFFTDAKERTQTARATQPSRIMILDEGDFMRLYYQQPAFALYVVKLIASRLSQNRS